MSSASSPWVSARHLQHLLLESGVADRLDLQRAGLALLPTDREATVPVAALEALLSQVSDWSGEPLAGLMLGRRLQPATLGAIGPLLQVCSRLDQLLDTLVHFNGLLSNIGQLDWQPCPGHIQVRWQCRAGSARFQRHAREYVLAALATLLRGLFPAPCPPLIAVHLQHGAPRDAALQARYPELFGCPVQFGQSHNALLLPMELLQQPLPHGDAALRALLHQHAEQERQRRPRRPPQLDQTVRGMLRQGLPEDLSRATVAQRLGLSERSLHRHLAGQGTSFQALRHQVLSEQALNLLRSPGLRLDAVAQQLGFSSAQSFIRWFRREHGQSPHQYRLRSLDHEC